MSNKGIDQVATPDAVRGFEETLSGPVSYSGDNKPSMNFRVIQNALISMNATMTNMKAVMGLLKDEVIELRRDSCSAEEIKNMRVDITNEIKQLFNEFKKPVVHEVELPTQDVAQNTYTETQDVAQNTYTETQDVAQNTYTETQAVAQNTYTETQAPPEKIQGKPKRGRKPANRAKGHNV